MFGRRPDGRRVPQEDPIIELAAYLMPQRVDAQVHSVQHINCDILTNYIRQQRDKGYDLSYMDLVIAAYVRVISQHPELNRFIHNKQLYARNAITVSLVVLKKFEDENKFQEATIKIPFKHTDTIYDVHETLKKNIEENRKPETVNNTDKTARFLLRLPGFLTGAVGFLRLLDRYGIMPRAIVDVSPFHTSLFFVNMMSLGMPHVNHHIYNFGNTSVFICLGKVERTPVPGPNGTIAYQRRIPLGVVSDERITSGAEYARGFGLLRDLLADPVRLETSPEKVLYDFPPKNISAGAGKGTATDT